jgi:hypothetical protein
LLTRLILTVLLLVRAGLAMGFPNEPNGFGKAHLGMTVDQVKKALPQMEAKRLPPEGGPALLAIYKADNQSIYGLKPCAVDLFFDPQRLYQISFDCGRSEKVVAALQKKFGDPSQMAPGAAFWQGQHTTVSLNVKVRTFAFFDQALNSDVQKRLSAYVMAHQGQAGTTPAAQAEPPPAATPQ